MPNHPPSMPWIKLYTTLLDNACLNRLPERTQLIYYKLMMLSGRLDAGGHFVQDGKPLDTAGIAWLLHLDPRELEQDITALCNNGLMSSNGQGVELIGWESDQGPAQADKRAAWLQRQNKHRGINDTVTRDAASGHALITRLEEEEEEEEEKEEEKDPPTDCEDINPPVTNRSGGSRYTGKGMKYLDTLMPRPMFARAVQALGIQTDPGALYDNMPMRITRGQFVGLVAAIADDPEIDNIPAVVVNRLQTGGLVGGYDAPQYWQAVPGDLLLILEIERGGDHAE